MSFQIGWDSCTADSGTGNLYVGSTAADNVISQDTAGTATWRVSFDGYTFQFDSQPAFNGGIPAPRPCEDDRPLTEDSWYCPECKHLHGRRHYKNWKDGPPYCPHCKTEFKSWDEIEFLPQKEIDRLNRERRWRTRDD